MRWFEGLDYQGRMPRDKEPLRLWELALCLGVFAMIGVLMALGV